MHTVRISLVQRNIVVSQKIWNMGLLFPFDIENKIFSTNVLWSHSLL